MKIRFQKYQGTGNDFIVVDNRNGHFPSDNELLVRNLCDRKFGIGSDGLILLEKDDAAEFYMNFYNPDFSQSFCGNGSRCIIQFAVDNGIIEKGARFNAINGMHEGYSEGEMVYVKMNDVIEIKKQGEYLILDTGSPHLIEKVENADDIDLIERARQIRYSEPFKEKGINVNFVETIPTGIKMRTYERGVEGETLSCGTGVTAAALAHANGNEGEIYVETKGGKLLVKYVRDGNVFKDIWLCGPAKKVYEGELDA
ncbi:MAG: diaminopimelate epimerase [Flavobacteriales bacterium]|nr:diaminopimelate epimerase [Flavobacteriales bacterium]